MQSVKAYKNLEHFSLLGLMKGFPISCTIPSCRNCSDLVKDVFGTRVKLGLLKNIGEGLQF